MGTSINIRARVMRTKDGPWKEVEITRHHDWTDKCYRFFALLSGVHIGRDYALRVDAVGIAREGWPDGTDYFCGHYPHRNSWQDDVGYWGQCWMTLADMVSVNRGSTALFEDGSTVGDNLPECWDESMIPELKNLLPLADNDPSRVALFFCFDS